ncbi:TetR/AcrR family transcriptional regulator [Pseudoclavibacter chungangensis]|uniref:TetR/AcrR family transcriptional regulator n=1 Tax=Pseudoclavibacter chungangensis TaxID=587635 RepID=A0A7J5BPS6_9MICO|nr:TetR/AcrR family transcriptional regulator [Pseudoclavibacter chungangensis]KAB1652507.1 TetR/AcrR family transcriptional regulator [Pseudoclavibacter chungangensis]NYJ66097.1 AcrR family transcriptional regulator [Pseudoclavibacter chungangensis]
MSTARGAYHHGDLAVALERAAMELLAQRPAAEISLREVARAADASHNAPYHHFADRRGLLKVLAERSMAALLDDVRAAAAEASSPVDVVRRGGTAYIVFAVERSNAFAVIYDPTVCVPGAPTETMGPLIASLETLLGEASGRIGVDPTAVWGLVHGLGTLAAAGHFGLEDAVTAFESALARLTSPGSAT